MPINIRLKLLLTLVITCFLNGNAFANYKHKVVITEFDDPENWTEPFSPGKVLAERLKKELAQGARFQIIPDENVADKIHPKLSESQMMDSSENRMPNDPKMNVGMGKSSLMDRPVLDTIPKNITHSESSRIQTNRSMGLKRQPRIIKIEDSHASFQKEIDIEPAVHFVDKNEFDNLLLVEVPSNGMMEKKGMMQNRDKMAKDSKMMHSDPFPWPVKLGKIPEKASLFQIRGQVVKFDPGGIDSSMEIEDKTTRKLENAEIEIKLQLVQNKTGRVIEKQTFRAFSNSGNRPFSRDMDVGPTEWHSNDSSSMSLALSYVTKEMADFVEGSLSSSPLEGEIISINKEDVLINIGQQNGVEVGDKFLVYSVGLHLKDPLTKHDLGDIYEKMGYIQVMDSRLGFSKAVILVGKDFFPGNLVRSFQRGNFIKQRISSGLKSITPDENIPWWEFRGIKSVP